MWLVLCVAVGLTIARAGPEGHWLARYWFMLVAAFAIVNLFWFVVLPRKSLKLAAGDPDRQRRLLQWIVNTPWFSAVKVHARYMLHP
jgi:hypothetical protein